jgi:hypothetical protein
MTMTWFLPFKMVFKLKLNRIKEMNPEIEIFHRKHYLSKAFLIAIRLPWGTLMGYVHPGVIINRRPSV